MGPCTLLDLIGYDTQVLLGEAFYSAALDPRAAERVASGGALLPGPMATLFLALGSANGGFLQERWKPHWRSNT